MLGLVVRRRRRAVSPFLVFTTQPGGANSGSALSPQPVVTAKKADGTTDTSFVGNVTLAVNTITGSHSLGGTVTVAAVAGVATFTNVTDTGSGGASLTATATSYQSATSASFTTSASGGTTFTNAIHFAGATHGASAAHHASYDDLPAFTIAVLVRWDGASGNGGLAAKRDTVGSSNGWKINLAGTSATDLSVDYVTTDGFKRATDLVADNSWQWLFIGSDRSAHTTTRAVGPQGGTIADVGTHVQSDGGAGAFVTDAAQPFTVGFDGATAGASVMEIRFVGITSSVLSLANMQAIAADALGNAGLFIDYWKPSTTGGSGTSIPSGKGILPPLVTVNATVV